MDLIMNGLLAAGSLFAGFYCWMLSRRVRALTDLDAGLGGAITTLTRQLGQAEAALAAAKAASRESRGDLGELIRNAEGAAGQLRLLIAASRASEPGPRASARPAAPVEPPAPAAHRPPPISAPDPASAPASTPAPASASASASASAPASVPAPGRPTELRPIRLSDVAPALARAGGDGGPGWSDVPKPRQTVAFDPLRLLRGKPAPEGAPDPAPDPAPESASEAELIAVLDALAAGNGR